MFKVKYFDELYTVYAVNRNEYSTYFLVYKSGEWKWIDSLVFEPVEEE